MIRKKISSKTSQRFLKYEIWYFANSITFWKMFDIVLLKLIILKVVNAVYKIKFSSLYLAKKNLNN